VYSDNEDVVIEEEKIVYPEEAERRSNSQEVDSEELLRSFEVLQLNFKSAEEAQTKPVEGLQIAPPPVSFSEPPKKLVYRNKYTKINPNIIIDCLHNEPTIRALKMLFDWLRINPEILIGCYHLCAGIFNYKRLSARMEEIYDLDLKYLIDFSIISDGYISDMIGETKETSHSSTQAVDKSLEAVSFALDTIHSSLLSLGDLHRYFLDFRIDSKLSISKEQVAKYYLEAFKLNPAIGMAQNQLGTLYYGQNHDLDSTYHYLYSLVCIIPFELSENNLNKLFAKHTEYLEQMDPEKLDFSIEDFFARFYLIVDIFFFDKEVPDFNALCHCVLIDLRKILCSQQLRVPEPSIFKIVSILFFCLSKLKMINSPKVYSLHAFLVAACSDLMDACIVSIEQTILARAQDNERFQAEYEQRFQEFDTVVRKSRNEYKNWLAAVGECERKDKKVIPRPHSLKDCSSDSRDSQHSGEEAKTQEVADVDKIGEAVSTRSSDEAKESDLKTPLSCKSKRRGMRLRRRRRKIAQSDDSSCYDSESELDTDFYSDEEDYTDLSSNFDTDFSDIDAADPGEPCGEEHYEAGKT